MAKIVLFYSMIALLHMIALQLHDCLMDEVEHKEFVLGQANVASRDKSPSTARSLLKKYFISYVTGGGL